MSAYSPTGSPHPLGDVVGQTPTGVTVTTSSTQLLAANEDRRACIISNIGIQDIYIAIGNTAVVSAGLPLPKGEQIVLGDTSEPTTEAINAITLVATSDIAILEFE